jgi:hypothetical protein
LKKLQKKQELVQKLGAGTNPESLFVKINALAFAESKIGKA